ncbi:hypothetical protein JCGZ_03181 [Jatropha curcas]|uniref:Uncharacterized protein n=1 Tax=Jatropha curcas TaxID=180498 RepID=A0A067L995_JATCU|nr:hypothetical protein JCGZ_03181 [Jatropha curcas]
MVERRSKELKNLLSMYKRHRKREEDKASYCSKLESTKRKLHSYYQEADKVKRQKQIQIIDVMDLPKATTKTKVEDAKRLRRRHHHRKVAAIAQHYQKQMTFYTCIPGKFCFFFS